MISLCHKVNIFQSHPLSPINKPAGILQSERTSAAEVSVCLAQQGRPGDCISHVFVSTLPCLCTPYFLWNTVVTKLNTPHDSKVYINNSFQVIPTDRVHNHYFWCTPGHFVVQVGLKYERNQTTQFRKEPQSLLLRGFQWEKSKVIISFKTLSVSHFVWRYIGPIVFTLLF